jgi:hypothetical protein
LWLAGEVSTQRDLPLIRRLLERVRRCAAHRPLLVCTDGLVSYIRAIRETFRDPVRTETLRAAAGRRDRAAHCRWHARTGRDVKASVARGRRDQYRVHRAAQRNVSGAAGVADPTRARPGAPHPDVADVVPIVYGLHGREGDAGLCS